MARVQGMTPEGIRKAIAEAISFIKDLNVEDLNKLLAAFEDANGIFDVRLVEAQEEVKKAGEKALEAEAQARLIIEELARYQELQDAETDRILDEVAVAIQAANLASDRIPSLLERLATTEQGLLFANTEFDTLIVKQDEFLDAVAEQTAEVARIGTEFVAVNQAAADAVEKVDQSTIKVNQIGGDLELAKATLDAKIKQNQEDITDAQKVADEHQNAIDTLTGNLDGLTTDYSNLSSNFSTEVEKLEAADASLLSSMNTKVGALNATTAAQATAISEAKAQADKGVSDASAASLALSNYKTVNDPKVSQAQKDAAKGIEDASAALTRANTAAGQLPGMNTAISNAASEAKKANDALPAIRTDITNISTKVSTATGNLSNLESDVASKVAALQAMDQAQAGEISTTNSKIDNLQIGGRNLARRRNLAISSQYQSVVDTGEKFWTGEPIYYGEKFTSGTPPISLSSNIRIEPGETYTISMWIRGETDSGKTNANILFYDLKLAQSHASTTTGDPASEWHLISGTVHNDTGTAYESVATYFYLNRNPGEKTWFTSPKLERGNKPTDWTPAPEDVDARVAKAQLEAETARAEAVSKSQAAQTAAELYAKEKSEADTAASLVTSAAEALRVAKLQADAAKAAAATDAQAKADEAERLAKIHADAQAKSAKETAEANAALDATTKANKAKTDAETKAAQLATAAQDAAATALNTYKGVNDPKVTKAQTDATKAIGDAKAAADKLPAMVTATANAAAAAKKANDALPAIRTDITNVSTRISTATGNLSSLESDVASKVAALQAMDQTQAGEISTTNSKIDNLEIGGRNLALGTAEEQVKKVPGVAIFMLPVSVSALQGAVGKVLTLSFDAISDVDGYKGDIYVRNDAASRLISTFGNFSITTEKKRYEFQVTLASGVLDTDRLSLAIRASATGTMWVSNLKLERGTKATDWSPAPEDVDADIAKAQLEAETARAEAESKSNAARVAAELAAKEMADQAQADAEVEAARAALVIAQKEAKAAKDAAAKDATEKADAAQTAAETLAKAEAKAAKETAEANAAIDATTKANKAKTDAETKAATLATAAQNAAATALNTYKGVNDPKVTKAQTDATKAIGDAKAAADKLPAMVTATSNAAAAAKKANDALPAIRTDISGLTTSIGTTTGNLSSFQTDVNGKVAALQAMDQSQAGEITNAKKEASDALNAYKGVNDPKVAKAQTDATKAIGDAKAAADKLPAINTSLSDAATKANQAVAALPGLTSGVSNAQKSADDTLAYAQAISQRGDNLIPNGFGELKSNKYFENFTYIPDDSPIGTYGSFETISLSGGGFGERISVDPMKPLTASLWVKKLTADQRVYFAIEPYDSDDLMISPHHWMETNGTRTQLAKPLRKGDTEMYLVDADSAAWAGSNMRGIIVWNYVDKQGRTWPPGTYSRNYYSSMYQPEGVNGNVITFTKPWGGDEVEAGTWVGNGRNGGTYLYPWTSMVTNADWEHFEGIVGGSIPQGNTLGNGMPAATVAVRPRILLTPQVAKVRVAGLSLTYTKTIFNSLEKAKAEVSALNTKAAELTTGLSNAATQEQYNTLNTRLWGNQGEINTINANFQTQQNQINANNTAFQTWQTDINTKRGKWEDGATLALQHLTDFTTRQTKWNKASTDATNALANAATAQKAFSDNQTKWNLASTNATKALADLTTEQGKVLALQTELNTKRDRWESGATLAIDNLTNFATRQTKWNKASTDATKALSDAATAQKAFSDNQTKWNLASTNATKALADLTTEQGKVLALQTELNTKRDRWEDGATLAIDNLTNFSVRQTKWNKASTDATNALTNAAAAQKAFNDNQTKWNLASTNATKALADLTTEQGKVLALQTELNTKRDRWEDGATLAIDNLTNFSTRQTKWNLASTNATKALSDSAAATNQALAAHQRLIEMVYPDQLSLVPMVPGGVNTGTSAKPVYRQEPSWRQGGGTATVTGTADMTDKLGLKYTTATTRSVQTKNTVPVRTQEVGFSVWVYASAVNTHMIFTLADDTDTRCVQQTVIKEGPAAGTHVGYVFDTRKTGTLPVGWRKIEGVITLKAGTKAIRTETIYFNYQHTGASIATQYFVDLKMWPIIPAQADVNEALTKAVDSHAALFEGQNKWNDVATSAIQAQATLLAKQDRWSDGVDKALAWQDQLNNAQSDINKTTKSVLANQAKWNSAQAIVNDSQSNINKATKLVLDNQTKWNSAQEKVNNDQSELNKAVKLVQDKQIAWSDGVTKALAAHDELFTKTSDTFKAVKEVNTNQGKWNTAVSDLITTNKNVTAANKTAIEGLNRVLGLRYSSSNLVPMVPGGVRTGGTDIAPVFTPTPAWMTKGTRVTVTDIPGITSIDAIQQTGQATPQFEPYYSEVDPTIEYKYSYWAKANVTGTRMYIELKSGESTAFPVQSNTQDNHSSAGQYLAGNVLLAAGWKQYTGTIRFKPDVRTIYFNRVYYNHPNGVAGTQTLADIQIYPNIPSQADVNKALIDSDKSQTTLLAKQEEWNDAASRSIATVENLWGKTDAEVGELNTLSKELSKRITDQGKDFSKSMSEMLTTIPQIAYAVDGSNVALKDTDGFIEIVRTKTGKQTSRVIVVAGGTWVGSMIVEAEHGRSDGTNQTFFNWTPIGRKFNVVSGSRMFTLNRNTNVDHIGAVKVTYFVSPGQVVPVYSRGTNAYPDQDKWHTLSSYVAPETSDYTMSLNVTWGATTYNDDYGVRIRAGSKTVAEIKKNRVGPLLPGQGGVRSMPIGIGSVRVSSGTRIYLEAYSNSGERLQRRIVDWEGEISHITSGRG